MRFTRNARLPFDPKCEFVWLKGTKVNGVVVAVGDPVDKGAFSERRLRQLYAADRNGVPEGSGVIAYAPGQKPAQPALRPVTRGPLSATRDADTAASPVKKTGIKRLVRAAA